MMIGVICTCAPSFSRALQEQPSLYQRFKSGFQSAFRSVGGWNPARSSSGYERRGSHQHGDHVSPNDRLARSVLSGDRGYELHGCNFVHNNERKGPEGIATEAGIHLKSETLGEREAGHTIYTGHERTWAPTETDMV